MPDRSSKPKRPKLPRDLNQRAKAIVDHLTRDKGAQTAPEAAEAPPEPFPTTEAIREAAKALGRRGGLKGGRARAASMTPEQRAEIAKKAARARWQRKDS